MAITVLIPVYQAEKYLSRCLDSVLNQTFSFWKAILLDDGSTDNSRVIMDDYMKRDNRFQGITIAHTGLSEVRNKLIAMNTSEFFFFLDADDFLAPECLEILYDTAQKYQADIAQCQMDHRTSKDSITDTTDGGIDVYTREEALLAYNRTIDGPRCMSAGKLYRREVFKGIEYPHDGRTNEDEYVAFHLIDQCKRFAIVQRKLYGYYHNPASIMRSPFNLSRYDALPPILESIDFFREKGMTSQVDRISFRYLVVIQSLYQNTALHFPEEKERMIKLLKEYDWFLPRVLTNLDLPDEVSGQLLGWRQDPMKTKVNGYWYYVGNGLLPD